MYQLNQTVSTPKIHKLQGKALKQWWQMGDGFLSVRLMRPKVTDKYANQALRSQLLFLCQLPFGMAVCYHVGGPATLKIILLAGAAGIAVLLMFLAAGRRHLRYALTVQQAEDGLLIKSLSCQRKIGWHEIVDFFPTQNGEFFVLDCNRGGQFFLSNDLTDFDGLNELIRSKVGKPSIAYGESYILPDGFVDGLVPSLVEITGDPHQG